MSDICRPARSKRWAGRKPNTVASTIPVNTITRWCAYFSFPAVSACWSGRDLEDREKVHNIVISAGRWSVALVLVLGLAGGFFVTRRVLRRVDAMTETTRTIVEGDLSGRLFVAGTGDELDRLAENLNAMLERIEALMRGLQEVSDNIAHDLKTPLTRLRNRAEDALRAGKDESDYRAALERTIEESDELIRTFNALLMIARAESGHARDDIEDFDAAEVARDIAELYEPVAEEKGLTLQGRGAGSAHGARQARTGQPGALQPGRQCHQICRFRTAAMAPSLSPPKAKASGYCSRSPTTVRAFPKPTGRGWWNALCGSSAAAPSRARAWD